MEQPLVGSLVSIESNLHTQFRRLDPVKAAATFAGLLTAPTLQSSCYRIEALIHVALALGHGSQSPSPKFIARAFKAFGEGICGVLEDPAEDMFVTAVRCRVGNFLVLEGMWEGGGFFLQRFLDVIDILPDRSDFNGLRSTVLSLLRLSDLACTRAGLKRWQLGAERPCAELPRRSVETLGLRRRHLRFKVSDLIAAGVNVSALDRFAFDPADQDLLLQQALGSTLLEVKPVVRTGQEIWLVLPTAVTAAIRYAVIRWMTETGNAERFLRALAGSYEQLFRETPLLGGPMEAPVRFTWGEDSAFAEVITNVDIGRYLHFVFFMDTLEEFESTGLAGESPVGMVLGEPLDARLNAAYDRISKRPDFREGLTMLVGCGVGRGLAIDFGTRDLPGWRVEHCSAYDFHTLSWTPTFSPLSLWRMLDARDELERLGTKLMNINGLINLVGWARTLEGHMVPHAQMPDGFSDGPGTVMIVVDQASQRKLRHESATASDVRVEQDVYGRWRRLRRSNVSVFKEDDDLPLYASEDVGQSGKPMAAYLAPKRVWWAETESRKSAPEFAYERWRTVEVWLSKAARVLDGLEGLCDGPILWRAIFNGAVGERMTEREILNYGDARGSIKVSVDVTRRVVTTEASEAYERAQFHGENIAERALVAAFVEGVLRLTSIKNADADETLVDQIVTSPFARHGHAFVVRGFRDHSFADLHGTVVTISQEEDAFLKLNLGWQVHDRSKGNRLEGKEECTAFLNRLVGRLQDQLIDELRKYNREALIMTLLLNHERAAVDRDRWLRTSAANLALHEDRVATIETITRHEFKLNTVFQTTRIIIEFAICEAPHEGGLQVGELDLSRLMAIAMLLSGMGAWSDAIRWDAMEPNLRITPFGDVHANFDWIDTVIRPFGQKLAADRVVSAERSYAENLKDFAVSPTIGDQLDPDFAAAWVEQFGATIDEARVLIDFIENKGVTSEKAVLLLRKSDIKDVTTAGMCLAEPGLSALLDNLTLRPRSRWQDTPEGYEEKDRFPWRHRRRLSVLRKPFIQIDQSTDPSFLVAPGLLRDAFGYMILNYMNGDFPEAQLSPKMRNWRAKTVGQRGIKLAQEAAEKLQALGWQTRVELKVTELLGRKFDRNYGDVDVLAWHSGNGRVLVIECKDVQFRKSEGDIAEQLSDYRGELKADGKRDELLKHLDRVNVVNENITAIRRFTGIADVPAVESHLLFRHPVPMKFALASMSEKVHICDLAEVETLHYAMSTASKIL